MDAQQFQQGIAALYRTGHHLLQTGNPKRAASIFRSMITAAPEDERGWLALGVCHEEVEQPEVALEVYRSASFILTRAARCELACARLLRKNGDDELASTFYELAREHAEDDDELCALIDAENAS